MQELAKATLRVEERVEEWTDVQGNAAFLTTQEFLEATRLEIVGLLKWQRRQEFYEQQQELFEIRAPVVRGWTLEKKRLEEINAHQPGSGRFEEDAEAGEPETPPQPPAPPAPHQLLAAQPLALQLVPEEVGEYGREEAMASKNMVVEVEEVIACDGGKGMMESMQMDKEKELLLKQPHQQQPQLPGAAAPNPSPLPQSLQPPQLSVEAQQLPLLSQRQEVGGEEHEEVMVSKNMVEIGGVMSCDGGKGMMECMQMDKEKELLQQQAQQQQPQLPGAAAPDPWPPSLLADLHESSSEREIGSRDFLCFVLGGRETAGSFAFGKCEAKGGQINREQEESDWKREGIGTGWSFSIFGGWGHERRGWHLTRSRRTRLREKR